MANVAVCVLVCTQVCVCVCAPVQDVRFLWTCWLCNSQRQQLHKHPPSSDQPRRRWPVSGEQLSVWGCVCVCVSAKKTFNKAAHLDGCSRLLKAPRGRISSLRRLVDPDWCRHRLYMISLPSRWLLDPFDAVLVKHSFGQILLIAVR